MVFAGRKQDAITVFARILGSCLWPPLMADIRGRCPPAGSDAMGGVGVEYHYQKEMQTNGSSSVNAGLNLQESNKWGNSSQFNFCYGLVMILLPAVRGSTTAARLIGQASLSDTAATRIPYPTEPARIIILVHVLTGRRRRRCALVDMDTTRSVMITDGHRGV